MKELFKVGQSDTGGNNLQIFYYIIVECGNLYKVVTFRMSLEPLQCPICLDPLRGLPSWKEVLSTPCGHLFCNTCLVTALRYGLAIEAIIRHQAFFWQQECMAMPYMQKEDQG